MAAVIGTVAGAAFAGLTGGVGVVFSAQIGLAVSTYIASSWFEDPLIIDLDNDGFELTSQADSTALFDMTVNGQVESTGWVGSGDGFLVHDLDGDGIINDRSEMFSSVYSGGSFASGFDSLHSLDENNDGVFNANDSAFSQVQIWQDLDQDGESDSGELMTLAEAGLESIDLGYVTHDPVEYEGNIIELESSATLADGSSVTVADAALLVLNQGFVSEGVVDGIRLFSSDDGFKMGVLAPESMGLTVDAAAYGLSVLVGGEGNDTFSTTGATGVALRGGDGNDILTGGIASDILNGGAGADPLSGGEEKEVVKELKEGNSKGRKVKTMQMAPGGEGLRVVEW
ncbi:MAG: hypothetical protein HQL72_07735 [Magnetococcales bacterium]|nr:hypothetical protein [Magnetococcales bacterium]